MLASWSGSTRSAAATASRKSPGVRDWAVGESSTVCPEPANEGIYPVHVISVSGTVCTNGMARLLQMQEDWSGTIRIARRD
jgi:hypothetical protein